MKKFLLLFVILILNINLCFASNEICYDNSCFKEIYSYPKLGFYAFLSKDNKTNNIHNQYSTEAPIAKLARLYPFDNNYLGKFIICYRQMPNVDAFKNAPKNKLGDLEQVARNLARNTAATGHLSVNLKESGYIQHIDFLISTEGQIVPIRKYIEY